jgi:hypothetical protein
MDSKFVVKLDEDENGDLILPIPNELCEQLGWQEEDEVEFSIDEYSDAFYIRKVD